MCDQTEVRYLPNDIVWVKLGPVWWPCRVCKEDEVPPEVMKDLRKTPIAIVKFFQEESFEYVKKLTHIYHYNCLKKNDFIKKGLDMLRLKNRDAPSNMKLFPEDVVKAEYLTGGNTEILQDNIFQPEEKPTYTDLFSSAKKSPKKVKSETKKKVTPVQQTTPRVITHPRFLRLSSGQGVDYEARERKQEPLRAECDEEDNSPPTTYRCTDCEFTTIRLNVMVLHNKSHTRNYASPQSASKAAKRKSTSITKPKNRILNEWRSREFESTGIKTPKTNGALTASPKRRGRPRKSAPKEISTIISADTKKSNHVSAEQTVPVKKLKRSSDTEKTHEFHKSLLEDWAEFETEQENEKQVEDDVEGKRESLCNDEESVIKDEKNMTSKSCFDFDDNEDAIIVDQSKIKFGRKLPRVLDDVKPSDGDRKIFELDDTKPKKSAKTEVESEEAESQPPKMDIVVDNNLKNDQVTIETVPRKRKKIVVEKSDPGTETATNNEASELADKVNKLLEETSKSSKIPDLPRSHKKAHLKAYQESLEKENAERLRMEQNAKQEDTCEITSTPSESVLENNCENANTCEVPEKEIIPEPLTNPESLENINENSNNNEKAKNSENVETQLEISAEEVITESTSDKPVKTAPSVAESSESEEPTTESVEQTKKLEITAETTDTKQPPTTDVVVLQSTPAKTVSPSPVKFATTPKLKQISTGQLLKSGQKTYTLVHPSDDKFKTLLNAAVKLSANVTSTGASQAQSSPVKAVALSSGDSSKAILKMADGRSIVCSLPTTPQKLVINSQSVNSSTGKVPKLIVLNRQATVTSKSAVNTIQNRSIATIDLSGTKVRVTPNILQKAVSATSTTAVAMAGKPTTSVVGKMGKNIVRVITSNSLQAIMQQSQVNKSSQLTSEVASATSSESLTETLASVPSVESTSAQDTSKMVYVGEDGKSYELATPSSQNQGESTEFNYIVDASGNLIETSAPPASTSTVTKDILAKALENTDGLQTEMALSDAPSTILEPCNVTQNTGVTYKVDNMYENVTLNTPPIMSAYETPSRALNSTAVSEVPNEMIIISGSTENAEYVA